MPHLLALGFLVVSACADPFGKTDPDNPDRDSAGVDTADTGGGNDSADSGADTNDSADTADTGPDTGTSEVLVPGSA